MEQNRKKNSGFDDFDRKESISFGHYLEESDRLLFADSYYDGEAGRRRSEIVLLDRKSGGRKRISAGGEGEGNPALADLDKMQEVLSQRAFQYSICPIRYSIGFILFQRSTWIHMGGFPVLIGNMGVDEEAFCQYCMLQSKAIVVAENAVAGHLGYGPQNKEMEQYYQAHKEKFQLKGGV